MCLYCVEQVYRRRGRIIMEKTGSAKGTSAKKRGRPTVDQEDKEKLHPVHQFFSFHEEHNESWCLQTDCNKKIPGRHAGNMLSHLRSNHKKIHEQVVSSRENQKHKDTTGAAKKRRPTTLNGVKMSGPALELQSLRLVTEHGLSFASLDYDAYQAIIQPMIEAMPAAERVTISSNTIPPKIQGFADRIRKKLISEMEGKMISLQVDGCSKQYRHFMGINVQYGHEGKIVVRTLAVEELFASSTAANLRSTILLILRKYNIPVKNLVSFTSDNGANYLLAGKLLQEDVEDLDLNIDGEDLPNDVELLQGEFSIMIVRCAAHTLQLAVDDAVKGRWAQVDLKAVLTAVRKLANFLRTPTNVRQLKDANLAMPSLDVVTRWGSSYDMLKSVKKLKKFIEQTLACSSKERADHFLTEDEWALVDRVIADLRPVRKATSELQAQTLTLGKFFSIWTEMKMKLEVMDSPLAQSILRAVNERCKAAQYKDKRRGEKLSPLFNYPAFNAALFLDPRYFSLLKPDQVADGKAYLMDLWQRMQEIRGVVAPDLESDSGDEIVDAAEPGDFMGAVEQSEADSCSDNEGPLFANLLAQCNKERQQLTEGQRGVSATERTRIRALLDDYDRVTDPLLDSADVIEFWGSKRAVMPELYELAMVVLAIPATQVSVERLFSGLRYILRPQRFNLLADTIDDIVFLHANPILVKELEQELLLEEASSTFL